MSPAAGLGVEPAVCPGLRELPGLGFLIHRTEGKDPCSQSVTGTRRTVRFPVACTERRSVQSSVSSD